MSGNTPPSERPPAEVQRCPRCGGVARPHKRRGAWANPFLSKPKTEITCEDCGLDFDPTAGTVGAAEAARPPGQSPWHKP